MPQPEAPSSRRAPPPATPRGRARRGCGGGASGSPISSTRVGVGISSSPYSIWIALRIPRSPPERTSGRSQVEEQEHLRGPAAEAADGDDLLDHLLVAELVEPVELQLAAEHVGGEVADVLGLAAGEAGAAQVLLARLEQLLGRGGGAAEEVEDPQVDRPRRFGRELLADDRPQQRAVGVGRALLAAPLAAASRGRSCRSARSAPPSSGRRRRAALRAFALTGPSTAGWRFSAKARMPSRKSSEEKQDSRRATRPASCCSVSSGFGVEQVDRVLVAAHRERRVGGDLGGQRDRRRPRARSSPTTSLTRPIRSARSASRLRPVRNSSLVAGQADRVEELAQAGVAVDQAELRRRHPQLGAGGADPQVAGDRQLEAAAEAVAVDRRDGRPGMAGDRLHRRVEGVGDERLGVALEGLARGSPAMS